MGDAEQELTGARLALDPAAIRGAIAELEQGRWSGLTEQDVEAKLEEVAVAIERTPGLEVRHVDWSCYGQGFASAVPVVISRTDDDAEEFRAGPRFGDFEGVVVALCRLAPLACIGKPSGERIGYAGMLGQGEFFDAQQPEWTAPLEAVDAVLRRHDIERLSPDVLNQHIDSSLEIDTNFGDPPYTVFDAWFHWWD